MPVGTDQALGTTAVELYRMFSGQKLTDEQADSLKAVLATDADGKWLECDHRGWFGGAVLEARALAGLFLLDERTVWSSLTYPIAQHAFRHIREIIDGADAPRLQVKCLSAARGSERIDFRNGGCLLFTYRASRAVRGFSADLVLVDDAGQDDLDRALMELVPCLLGKPVGQLVVNHG